MQYEFSNSINSIPASQWQALWQTDYPFIQHGFLASHFHRSHQTDTSIKIYDTGSVKSIWPLYREAVDDGADVIVGPLDPCRSL